MRAFVAATAAICVCLALAAPSPATPWKFARGNSAVATPPPPVGYPAGGHWDDEGFYDLEADGKAVTIACNPNALCQIAFPIGEKIAAKAIQDATRWDVPDTEFGPANAQRALVVVKVRSTDPLQGRPLHTQLVVLTNGWPGHYTITISSSLSASADGTRIAFVHHHGGRDRREIAADTTASPAPAPTLPPAAKPCNGTVAHGKYFVFADAGMTFIPKRVYNDGAHTCIVMNKLQTDEQPVVLGVGSQGDDTLNYTYRPEDGVYVVSGVPRHLVLQDGTGKGSARIDIQLQ